MRPTLPQPSGGVRWRLLFVCVGLSLCLSVSLCMQPVEYLFRYFEEAAAPPAPSRLVSVAIRAPAGLVAVADRRCARGVRPLYYFTVFQFSQFHHSSPVRCGYPVWQVRTLHIALYLPCAFPCRGGARRGAGGGPYISTAAPLGHTPYLTGGQRVRAPGRSPGRFSPLNGMFQAKSTRPTAPRWKAHIEICQKARGKRG